MLSTEDKIINLVGGNPRYQTGFESCTCDNKRKTGGDYNIWLNGLKLRVCKHQLVLHFHKACLLIGELRKRLAEKDQRIKELEYKIIDLNYKLTQKQ